MREFFTSESVTEGHPDKLCDCISDAVLDAVLAQDPKGRVAIETTATNGVVLVAGEMTTSSYVDVPAIARRVIKEAGYTDPAYGFHYGNCGVLTSIHDQSPDIAQGVQRGEVEDPAAVGAGDQGLMFGYATDETKELMPLPIVLAHNLTRRLAQVRKDRTLPYIRPDGKSQVTVEYENEKPQRVEAVVISAQHDPDVSMEKLKEDSMREIINPIVPAALRDAHTKYFINPTGRFVIGGPQGDTGLTGRKIIVDTYGGIGRHGGGAFSGKDPTKVDRSASYAARYVAKNIVAAGLAKKCEVRVAYAIGVAQPLSVVVHTYGTGRMPDEKITEIANKVFDLRPGMIIRQLGLRRPLYRQVAAYGHFGRTDIDVPWEKTDKVEEIKKYI